MCRVAREHSRCALKGVIVRGPRRRTPLGVPAIHNVNILCGWVAHFLSLVRWLDGHINCIYRGNLLHYHNYNTRMNNTGKVGTVKWAKSGWVSAQGVGGYTLSWTRQAGKQTVLHRQLCKFGTKVLVAVPIQPFYPTTFTCKKELCIFNWKTSSSEGITNFTSNGIWN